MCHVQLWLRVMAIRLVVVVVFGVFCLFCVIFVLVHPIIR